VNEKIEKWLNRYHNKNTRIQMESRITKFLDAMKLDDNVFVELPPEEAEDLILNYQREEEAKGTPNNTILSAITAPRALFAYLRKPLILKGQLVELEEARDKHQFSNGDIGKLFDVADTRGKAIISLASSLGWGISDVLGLDKEVIKTEIERAKESGNKFIFIKRQRGKTHAKALGVINPLAIEWLDKWLAINKTNKLFDINADQINKELQRFAEEAQLKLTGSVSFHCFRAWVLSSLVKAGFSEFECKLIVGKAIPLSDSTYLALEEDIKEKYPAAYDRYLNIKPKAGPDAKKQKELEDQLQTTTAELESLKNTVTELKNNELDWRGKHLSTQVTLEILVSELANRGIKIDLEKMFERIEQQTREYEEQSKGITMAELRAKRKKEEKNSN
jgi:hypothetical protein